MLLVGSIRILLSTPGAQENAATVVRGTFGIPLCMCGVLDGCQAYYFGSQGWEFLELGRIWQDLLFAGFGLWVLILFTD